MLNINDKKVTNGISFVNYEDNRHLEKGMDVLEVLAEAANNTALSLSKIADVVQGMKRQSSGISNVSISGCHIEMVAPKESATGIVIRSEDMPSDGNPNCELVEDEYDPYGINIEDGE